MKHDAVSGVVLAAGGSTRLRQGDTPKQLLVFAGKTLVRRATEMALASRLFPVIVVLGFASPRVREALSGLPVSLLENPHHKLGQSTSVRAGLTALGESSSGALFLPCDQPLLTTEVLDLLVSAHEAEPEAVVIPSFEGRRGAPVLFPRSLFPRLATLVGDQGGRQLLPGLRDRIVEVPLESGAPLRDIDTWEDYQAFLDGPLG